MSGFSFVIITFIYLPDEPHQCTVILSPKLTVSIPCEGSYCRALVALSFALSPFWFSFYLLRCFDVNILGWELGVFSTVNFIIGLMVMRFAPGGDGTMATMFAVS
jgi:sodium/potassium/calcium exchanger 6